MNTEPFLRAAWAEILERRGRTRLLKLVPPDLRKQVLQQELLDCPLPAMTGELFNCDDEEMPCSCHVCRENLPAGSSSLPWCSNTDSFLLAKVLSNFSREFDPEHYDPGDICRVVVARHAALVKAQHAKRTQARRVVARTKAAMCGAMHREAARKRNIKIETLRQEMGREAFEEMVERQVTQRRNRGLDNPCYSSKWQQTQVWWHSPESRIYRYGPTPPELGLGVKLGLEVPGMSTSVRKWIRSLHARQPETHRVLVAIPPNSLARIWARCIEWCLAPGHGPGLCYCSTSLSVAYDAMAGERVPRVHVAKGAAGESMMLDAASLQSIASGENLTSVKGLAKCGERVVAITGQESVALALPRPHDEFDAILRGRRPATNKLPVGWDVTNVLADVGHSFSGWACGRCMAPKLEINTGSQEPGGRPPGQVADFLLPGSPANSPESDAPREGWAPSVAGGLTVPGRETQTLRTSWLAPRLSFRSPFSVRKTDVVSCDSQEDTSLSSVHKVSLWDAQVGRSSLPKAMTMMRTRAFGGGTSWAVYYTACFDGLILLNTVIMALEAQHRGLQNEPGVIASEEVWPGAELAFLVLDWFFGILFALELLLSLAIFRQAFYRSVWGYLDTVIVLSWIVGVVTPGALPVGQTMIRVARLARLLRILRLVKAIKGFDSLYLMMTAIKSSVAALGWSIALLGVVQVMIALLLGQLLSSYWLDPDIEESKRHAVFRYYGSFSKSILTMFELMLANWPVASRVVTENVSEWYMTFTLVYQLVITFAVGKVIMGVFLQVTFHVASTDDTIMLRQQERAAALQRSKIGNFFTAIDEDGSCTVDRQEFKCMLDDQGVRNWLAAMEVDVGAFFEKEEDSDVLFELFCSCDQERLLSTESFVAAMGKMKGPARNVDLHVLLAENRRSTRLLAQIRKDCHRLRTEIMQWRSGKTPAPSAAPSAMVTPVPSMTQEKESTWNWRSSQGTLDSSAFASNSPRSPRDTEQREQRGPKTLDPSFGARSVSSRNSLDPNAVPPESRRGPPEPPSSFLTPDYKRVSSQSQEEKGARSSDLQNWTSAPQPPDGVPNSWPDAPDTEPPDCVPMEDHLRVSKPPRPSVEQLKTMFRSGTDASMLVPGDRWTIKTVIDSSFFEVFVLFLIVMNTMVMALEAQYKGLEDGFAVGFTGMDTPANEVWPGAVQAFEVLDWIFGLLFTLELILKLVVLRLSYLRDLSNLLDATIVASWLLTKVGNFLPMDATFLRLIRLGRLLRVIRIAKAIQGFDALYVMMTSLKASCSALLWSSVVLFLLQTMIALVLQVFLEDFIRDEGNDPAQRELVYQYFGTYSRATFSLFEITLANWIPVSRTLTETVSEWYVIFALGHKFVIGFAVVTVLTGVFLQETFKVAQTDNFIMMTKRERAITTHTAKMQKLFKAADTDASGHLNKEEFMGCVGNPTVKTWLAAMGLQVSDAALLFDMIDDGDGELTAEELVKGVARMKGGARALDMAVLTFETHRLNDLLKRTRDENRQFCGDGNESKNSTMSISGIQLARPSSNSYTKLFIGQAMPERSPTPTGRNQNLVSLRDKLQGLIAGHNTDIEPTADSNVLQECLQLASAALGEDDPRLSSRRGTRTETCG